MAYNTSKGPRGFGDLQNEDDIDTQIDWDNDKITFRTNNIARFVINNSQISASGDATIVGDLVTEGNLSISGSTTFAGGTTFTNISGSGTLQMVGATVLGNTLNVSGAISGAANIVGASYSGDGAVTMAGDIASTGGSVSGSSYLAGLRLVLEGQTTINKNRNATLNNISGSGILQAVGATTLGNTLNVTGAISGASTATAASLACDGTVAAGGNISSTGGSISGSAQIAGLRLVLENQTAIDKNRNTNFNNISGSGTLQAVGAATLGSSLNVTGAVTLAGPSSGSAAGDGSFLAVSPAGLLVLDTPAAATTSPGGSTTQVQFNDGGAFGGDSGLTYNKTTDVLSFTNLSGSGTLQAVGATVLGSTLKVSGACTFDTITVAGTSGGEGAIFEQGLTIKNADASAGFINFYEQSSNGTNVCTFRGKSSMGNCTITLPGQTGTVVLLDDTVTLSNKTITAPILTGITTAADISGSGTLQAVGATTFGSTLNVTGAVTLAGPASGSIAGPGSYVGVNGAGLLVLTASSGGTATDPGGSTTQVQFNDGGSFAGDAGLTYNKTTDVLSLVNASGSGTLQAVGATYLGNILHVSGALSGAAGITGASYVCDGAVTAGGTVSGAASTFTTIGGTSLALQNGGITNAGAIGGATTYSGSSTLQVVGASTFGSTLNVSGAMSGAVGVIGASWTSDGAVSGAAGTFTSLGGISLALQNGGISAAGAIAGATTYSGSSTLQAVGATTLGSTLNVSGAVTLAAPASGSIAGPGSYLGVTSAGLLVLTASATAASTSPGGSDTQVQFNDGGSFGGDAGLVYNKTTDMLKPIHLSASNTLQAVGATTLGSTLSVSGTVTVAGDIDHAGDPDTYLRFQTNTVNLVAGGKSAIKLDTSTGKIQLNNSNENLDVQAMADDGEVILHADAGTNKVGINTETPSDALTVVGVISGSGILQAVGATYLGNILHVTGAVSGASGITGASYVCDGAITAGGTVSGAASTFTTIGGTSLALQNGGISATGPIAGATNYSGSGTFQTVGATYLGGALNVTGAVTLSGPASGSQAGPSSFLAVNAAGLVVLDEPAGGGGISFNGSTANGLVTYGNSSTADVESNLTFDGNTLTATNASNTAIPAITIDRNYTGTTSVGNYTTDPQGLLVDYDVTGIVAADQTAIHDAIAINFNQDAPTHVGTLNSTGLDCRMTGGTSGTQSMKGVAITLAGADTHTGVDITVPNDGTHIIARSPDNILDQFKISVGAAGATTLSTNDADAAVANLTLDADGKIVIDAIAGDETVFNEGGADVDFRVESDNDTHLLFVDGGNDAVSIGVSTDAPAAVLEIVGDSAQAKPTLSITHAEDTNNAVDINADSLTTGNGIDLSTDARTTGTGLRVSDSATNDSAGSLVKIAQTGNRAGSAASVGLEINFNTEANANARALWIDSEQTTGQVVEVDADKITTGKGVHISADALTTGNALYIDDSSSNTGTRKSAVIIQNDAAAIAATALAVQSDGGVTGVNVDKNFSDTTAATVTGLNIDFDKTATTTTNNTMYGLNIDMDNTTATNGNNTMYGLHVTPTLTHAADAGLPVVYGALINAQGGTNGTSIVQAARFEAGGGDLNYGIQLDVEDGGVDLRIESSADSGDYFQIQTTTAGASTITTVDDGGAAAHLTFAVDGDINLNPVGTNVVVGGNISGSGTLQAVGNVTFGAALNVTGAVTLAGAASGSQAGPSSFLAVNSAGLVVLDEPAGGGGGSPGGSDTQVQFNDSDSFGGDSGLTFNKTSNVLTVGGLSNAGSTVIDRVEKASGDSPYTMTATDHYIGLDTSGGTIQVDLQAAASAGVGRVIIIKDETGNAETNNITIDANGSETIDGSATQVINNAYGSLTLVCTNRGGKQWAIV